MRTVEVGQATRSLDKYVLRVRKQILVVTRRGKPVAALVPVNDADWESIRLGTNARFIRMIQRARAEHSAKGGVCLEEARRRLLRKR